MTKPPAPRLVRRLKLILISLIAVVFLVGWLRYQGWLPESWQRLVSFDDILKFGIIFGIVGSGLVSVTGLSIAAMEKQREEKRARASDQRPGQS
ncbi:MAG: hypothetical protein O7E49_09185 [Gemmatimonadetes bacterium]|nr:hypothetical protein [Gemmatimonadota bacterium]